ncbi:SGNH hydrolase [Polyplosphaeria fusca]|uniref:SGNH hydrolase n=1 Tax=Polyplosphaeria fusca TaxID=682080 RepID=A0A9P4V0H0_9PLEO|nr:SGNH hydrolase [Polyplosphaeria fusca]
MKFAASLSLLSLFAPVTFSVPHVARQDVQLRILPLGDSITFGYMQGQSTNGYREELRSRLVAAGKTVDMVGTQRSGSMVDNQNEGHSGWVISQVRGVIQPAIALKPNVVLIHLATNDLNRGNNPPEPDAQAPTRLGQLIDDILAKLPDAAIFVAKIVGTSNAGLQQKFNTYNAAIPDVVKARTDKGSKLFVVDMSVVKGNEMSDYLHPNAAGYKHMGDIWADAVLNNTASIKAPPS